MRGRKILKIRNERKIKFFKDRIIGKKKFDKI